MIATASFYCRMNGWPVLYGGKIYYYYNPCHPFAKGPFAETSACIFNSTYGDFCEIGGWNTTIFHYDGDNLIAEYNGNNCGFQRTTTLVYLICDPFVESPQPMVLGMFSECSFGLAIRSKHLCPIPYS